MAQTDEERKLKHAEAMKRWYQAHRPERIEAAAQYKAENPDKVQKANATYWEKNRVEINRKRREKRAAAKAEKQGFNS